MGYFRALSRFACLCNMFNITIFYTKRVCQSCCFNKMLDFVLSLCENPQKDENNTAAKKTFKPRPTCLSVNFICKIKEKEQNKKPQNWRGLWNPLVFNTFKQQQRQQQKQLRSLQCNNTCQIHQHCTILLFVRHNNPQNNNPDRPTQWPTKHGYSPTKLHPTLLLHTPPRAAAAAPEQMLAYNSPLSLGKKTDILKALCTR